MSIDEQLNDVKKRTVAGVLQSTITQGIPAMLGTIYSILGPKRLRRLAYGTAPASDERIYELVDRIGDAHIAQGGTYGDVNVVVKPNISPGFATAQIDKKLGPLPDTVILPLDAPTQTVAHEMGHLSPKSRLGYAVRKAAILAQKPSMGVLPSAIAFAGVIPGLDEATSVAAPTVGALQLAAILAEEGRANLRGAQLLEAIGTKMPIHRKLRMFLPTSSYLGRGGQLIAIPLAISAGIKAYNKSKEKGQPLTYREMLVANPVNAAELPTYKEFNEKWKEVYT